MSDNDNVGVIIFSERAVRGGARVYQKSSLPYLDSEDNSNEDEGGKGNSEEKEKEEGNGEVGGEGGG